MKHYMDRPEQ